MINNQDITIAVETNNEPSMVHLLLQNAYKWTIFNSLTILARAGKYKASLNFVTTILHVIRLIFGSSCSSEGVKVSSILQLHIEYWFYKMWSLCHPVDGVIVTLYVRLTIASTLVCQVSWFRYRAQSVLGRLQWNNYSHYSRNNYKYIQRSPGESQDCKDLYWDKWE